jgi:hypothetical protein
MDKDTKIINEWNYDASCMLTSLLVSDLENFKCLVSVVQSVPLATGQTIWFIHDGAPAHFTLEIKQCLDSH